MRNNRHAYQDYNGPRIAGVTPPKLDQQEENPLDALCAWQEGGPSLAPPCGSSVPLIHAMLDFASVSKTDVLYDLGCGDGRVLLEALVRIKCRQCVGIEIEPDLIERAQELIHQLPTEYRNQESLQQDDGTVTERIYVVHADLREVLSDFVSRLEKNETGGGIRPYEKIPMPDVITICLLPEGIAEIEDDLTKLLSSTRIVCACWGLKGLRPIEQKEYYDRTGSLTTMYLYTSECFERLKGFEYMLSVYNYGH